MFRFFDFGVGFRYRVLRFLRIIGLWIWRCFGRVSIFGRVGFLGCRLDVLWICRFFVGVFWFVFGVCGVVWFRVGDCLCRWLVSGWVSFFCWCLFLGFVYFFVYWVNDFLVIRNFFLICKVKNLVYKNLVNDILVIYFIINFL